MIISDLDHLEVVGEEKRVEGGEAFAAGSTASSSSIAYGLTEASISNSTNTITSIFGDLFSGNITGVVTSSSSTSTAAAS